MEKYIFTILILIIFIGVYFFVETVYEADIQAKQVMQERYDAK